jgi:hypothetical protein
VNSRDVLCCLKRVTFNAKAVEAKLSGDNKSNRGFTFKMYFLSDDAIADIFSGI